MSNLKKDEFKKYNVLVIGDSGEDVFQYGSITRICPEAPVPVFNPINKKSNPGMAGNVVANLDSLGINTTFISNPEKVTKTRLVDIRTNQMIVRVDENDIVGRIPYDLLITIKNNQYQNKKIDAIIISDYDKGFLTEDDIKYICDNNSNVFIDTKKILDSWCVNAAFIKINHVEYNHTKYSLDELKLENKLIITLSSDGCRYKDEVFAVKKVQIKDVSGAGDTFLSGLVSEYLRTKDIRRAISFAQECATVVVQKMGVSTI